VYTKCGLVATNLDTLELRRLRIDLVVCYMIVFGLMKVDVNKFFSFAPVRNIRGHRYKLFVEQSTRNVRHYFFCRRVVNLPPAVDFSTLVKFKRCLLQGYLSKYLLYCVLISKVVFFQGGCKCSIEPFYTCLSCFYCIGLLLCTYVLSCLVLHVSAKFSLNNNSWSIQTCK